MVNSITDWPGVSNVSTSGSSYTAHDRGDYVEVVIPSGGHIDFTVNDNGSFENVLINQEASGASHRVRTGSTGNPSSNYSVRFVGVTGRHGDDRIAWMVGSGGSNSIVEHVYLGDGIEGWEPGMRFSGAGGVMAAHGHSGHLVLRGFYLDRWSDNGIYVTQQEHPNLSQGMGTFGIEDSYVRRTDHAGFRVAVEGSYVRNCVAWEITERAMEADAQVSGTPTIVFEDCDAYGIMHPGGLHGGIGLNLSLPPYEQPVHADLRGDCQFSGESTNVNQQYGSTYSGTYGTNPDHRVPSAAPQSAEAAASGDLDYDPGDRSFDDPVCVRQFVDVEGMEF